jgi:F-type H+-transporting ATPase subunit a
MKILAIDFSNSLNWNTSTFSGEVIMSLIVMLLIAIFAVIIGIVFKHQDPLKPDKNVFVLLVETAVDKLEAYTVELMGPKWRPFTGYAFGLAMYIFFSFFIGITGLPGPLVSLTCPLSIGLCTFILIHATAVKANHWKYFHRYIEPIGFFLPINLLSMWAPLLSLSLRLFGNALSGFALMYIDYYFLELAATAILRVPITMPLNTPAEIWLAPFITSWLHLYFDLFSGVIQTLVFISLTMIWVSQEDPDEEAAEESASLKQAPANT